MNNPKALYVHIPFCEHICDYCDFTKIQYGSFDVQKYLNCLKIELESYQIKELDTIFVGGGTPSVLSLEELNNLLDILSGYSKNVKEYTFETNPESLNEDKLRLMYKYGVNRLSIGVESTDDKILSSINRHHTFNDVKNALKLARNIGFKNINVDLILGLPNVTFGMFKKDLDNTLALDVEHISLYSLTVHEHTVFGLNNIQEPEDDYARELYDYAHKTLLNKGFNHYEISNFAKDGFVSKHNLTYWKNERYYGVGLGASGYIGDLRYTNTKSINKYLNCDFVSEKEILTLEDEAEYEIILSLRTSFGLDLDAYMRKYNKDLYKERKKELDDLIKNGLLVINNKIIKPTYEGMMILDQIILSLIK